MSIDIMKPTFAQTVVMLDYLLNTKNGLNQHYCESIGQAVVYQASQGDLVAAQTVHNALVAGATREEIEASVELVAKNLNNPAKRYVAGCLKILRQELERENALPQ